MTNLLTAITNLFTQSSVTTADSGLIVDLNQYFLAHNLMDSDDSEVYLCRYVWDGGDECGITVDGYGSKIFWVSRFGDLEILEVFDNEETETEYMEVPTYVAVKQYMPRTAPNPMRVSTFDRLEQQGWA